MERALPEEPMLEIKNPEIDVDALVQSIQAKVQERRPGPPADGAGPGSSAIEQSLKRARDVAAVGADLPAMTRTQGVARLLAVPVAKAFLRMAQLITRDQRTFNLASVDVLRALYDRTSDGSAQVAALRAEIGALREQLARTEANLPRISALEASAAEQRSAHSETAKTLAALRVTVLLEERRLGLLLEEARRRLPEPFDRDQLERFSDEASRLDDERYLGF